MTAGICSHTRIIVRLRWVEYLAERKCVLMYLGGFQFFIYLFAFIYNQNVLQALVSQWVRALCGSCKANSQCNWCYMLTMLSWHYFCLLFAVWFATSFFFFKQIKKEKKKHKTLGADELCVPFARQSIPFLCAT